MGFAVNHPSLDFLGALPASAGASQLGSTVSAIAGKLGGLVQGAAQALDMCCCFPAGTPVETEFGPQPIEQIKVGQRVYARDPATGETALKPVTELITTQGKPLYQLVTQNIAFGIIEQMNVTDNHPYWVKGQGWVPAAELKLDMVLDSFDQGELKVVSLTALNRVETTYNFTVADFHTYFAGKQKVFVHNNGGCACVNGVKAVVTQTIKAGEDLFVGTYGASRRGNIATGLNTTHTPHHVVQNAVSETSHSLGASINMRRDLHEMTRSFKKNANLGKNISNLAADIWDIRNILRGAGYDRTLVNQQLRELIGLNRQLGNVK